MSEKRSSDPINIFNVTTTPTGWERIIAAITKSVTCVVVIGVGGWLLANRIEIPTPAWGIAALVVVGTFGLQDLYKAIKGKVNGN